MSSPDSLISRIIPTTDSLKASLIDDSSWYNISTYCNVEGDSWWVQLLTALIGAAIGGAIAGLVTWIMSKKQADEQLEREQTRDKMLAEFEKKRATLQKEIEEHRDKRQNTFILLQHLQEFAGYILDADRYAAINLSQQMKLPNDRESVLFFGDLVDKIEFLWQKDNFLLSQDISVSIKKIHDWMFSYKQQAMQCTMCATDPAKMYTSTALIQQKRMESCAENCSKLRSLWNEEWNQLYDKMKKMRNDIL